VSALRLTVRSPLTEPVSLEPVTPDRLATLDAGEIARIALWVGRQSIELGQLFAVSGGPSSVVHIEGDVSSARDLAAGMAGGEMVIEGNVGNDVARWHAQGPG
jgi:formylmethanofuran dehydrogenase subunit C